MDRIVTQVIACRPSLTDLRRDHTPKQGPGSPRATPGSATPVPYYSGQEDPHVVRLSRHRNQSSYFEAGLVLVVELSTSIERFTWPVSSKSPMAGVASGRMAIAARSVPASS